MRIAEETAQKVRDYGREQEMRPMNAFERRVVHMVLAEMPELETESIGEDPNRKVIVRLKQTQSTGGKSSDDRQVVQNVLVLETWPFTTMSRQNTVFDG